MKKSTWVYSITIYILLMIFFIIIHPIAISDTDDWTFIHHLRLPIPLIHAWNPIKVFPEISMSIFSYAGAYLIYPFTGRYCYSLSVSNGFFISLLLTVYFIEFLLLIEKKYHLKTYQDILVGILFFCLHFIIFAHPGKDNVFLFYSLDLTCIYHYTLSSILNAALVMHMMRYDGFHNWNNLCKGHRILIVVWTYLAIFSSLYTNVIIAAYIGEELLMNLVEKSTKKQFHLKEYCIYNRPHLIILFSWLCSMIIETTGGRSASREISFLSSLYDSLKNLCIWGSRLNKIFLIFVFVTAFIWIVLVHEIKQFVYIIKLLIAFILTTVYLVLLSAVVNSTYVTRADVIIASAFWFLLIAMSLLCELVSNTTKMNMILSFVVAFSIIETILTCTTYKEINYLNLSYKQCEALVNDVILQFKEADKNGENEIELIVPDFHTSNNWPYNVMQADDFTKAMYRHRITHKKIMVKDLILSEEKTKKYINLP